MKMTTIKNLAMLIARVILLAVFLPITLILTIVATPLANLTLAMHRPTARLLTAISKTLS